MFSSGCNRGILALASGGSTLAAAVQLLFAAGEQGVWYDYSDFSTLFQDSAGTTPVTAVGQPVGKVLDKSGRGNHKTQATAINRPILQQDASGFYYLATNGTNSSLATASIDFTGTGKMSVWAGVQKTSDAAAGVIAELGTGVSASVTTFTVTASSGAGANYRTDLYNTTSVLSNNEIGSTYTAPISNVVTALYDYAQASIATQNQMRVNGATPGTLVPSGSILADSNFGNRPLNIGARNGASLFFNGRLYSLIVRGAASSAAQIANAERYVGSKMGIQL